LSREAISQKGRFQPFKLQLRLQGLPLKHQRKAGGSSRSAADSFISRWVELAVWTKTTGREEPSRTAQ